MARPRRGQTTFLIIVSPLPGKYALARPRLAQRAALKSCPAVVRLHGKMLAFGLTFHLARRERGVRLLLSRPAEPGGVWEASCEECTAGIQTGQKAPTAAGCLTASTRSHLGGQRGPVGLKFGNASRFCVSSLPRGHANLLCIVIQF